MDVSETNWVVERFFKELNLDGDTLARKSGGVYP